MPPARTLSPPYTLIPNRWLLDSRLLRDDPCPFLCAISTTSRCPWAKLISVYWEYYRELPGFWQGQFPRPSASCDKSIGAVPQTGCPASRERTCLPRA